MWQRQDDGNSPDSGISQDAKIGLEIVLLRLKDPVSGAFL